MGGSSTQQNPTYTYPFLHATYTVTLTITTHDGCSSTYSEQVTVSRGQIRRLGQETDAFQLFPNPADKGVSLKYPDGLTGQAELIDLTGRVVMQAELATSQASLHVPTTELANGIYLIRIKSDLQTLYQEKIVIQH